MEYHLIGNGKSAGLYDFDSKGIKYTCNLPPFAVPDAKATFIVDFKMCQAIHEGSVTVPGMWICGARPKKYSEMMPNWYMKHAHQIKEFYLELPPYVANYTDFNCGHMAAHYLCNKVGVKNLNMCGFDSIFEFDLFSTTDLFLNSDRSQANGVRLTGNWRPIWAKMFEEFSDVKFKLHYMKNTPKIKLPDNVEIITPKK